MASVWVHSGPGAKRANLHRRFLPASELVAALKHAQWLNALTAVFEAYVSDQSGAPAAARPWLLLWVKSVAESTRLTWASSENGVCASKRLLVTRPDISVLALITANYSRCRFSKYSPSCAKFRNLANIH